MSYPSNIVGKIQLIKTVSKAFWMLIAETPCAKKIKIKNKLGKKRNDFNDVTNEEF